MAEGPAATVGPCGVVMVHPALCAELVAVLRAGARVFGERGRPVSRQVVGVMRLLEQVARDQVGERARHEVGASSPIPASSAVRGHQRAGMSDTGGIGVGEAADAAGVVASTIRRWCASGELVAERALVRAPGRRAAHWCWRISPESLAEHRLVRERRHEQDVA